MGEHAKVLEIELRAHRARGEVSISTADTLTGLAWELIRTDTPQALSLCEEAFAISDELSYAKGRAHALRCQGVCRWLMADYQSALASFLEVLRLFQELDDEDGVGTTYNNIGSVYYRLGDYANALDYFLRSLKLKEKAGDQQNQAKALNNIGGVFEQLGDSRNALDHYFKSLRLKEEINDLPGQAATLSNIGVVFQSMGEFEVALKQLSRSALIFEDIGDRYGLGAALDGLGSIHDRLGHLDRALDYLLRSLAIREEAGDREGEASVLVNLGKLRGKLGESESAFNCLRRALELAEGINARHVCCLAHEALSSAFEQAGEFAMALAHHKRFHEIKEEVFGSRADNRIKGIIIQSELEKSVREAEIYRLKTLELTRAYERLRESDEQKSALLATLRSQASVLERQTLEDGLTGLFNRRHVDIQLKHEFARARRFGRHLTVALGDLDYFKQINDQHSHLVGDEVLKRVARIILGHTRMVDTAGRYGGEELILLLVETPVESAANVCETIRAAIEAHPWHKLHPALKVTISFGLADDPAADTPEQLLRAADAKLYEAKRRGRNRVEY
jgi:diguanylate cyclase (GGDEF)-like protein